MKKEERIGAWELLWAVCDVPSLNWSWNIALVLSLCHSATWKNCLRIFWQMPFSAAWSRMFECLFKFSALSYAVIKGLCWSQALIQQPRRSLLYSELPRNGLCFCRVIRSDTQRWVFLSSVFSDAKCSDFPRVPVLCYWIDCFHNNTAVEYDSNEICHNEMVH